MEKFRQVAYFIKKSNVAEYPISIRRAKLKKGFDGLCEFKNEKFLIRINQQLQESHSIDVMLHEVSHAVAWGKDNDFHGLNWGKAYSRIYRMYLEKFS